VSPPANEPVRIVGSYLSPYVRKVLVFLQLKGLAYEIDPIVAFMGDDRFTALSPVRRIPVLIDGDVTLCDSSVICQYLEDRHPSPALYPRDVPARARARWLEEFADTRMGDVFIWRLFNQLAIKPYVWGTPTDQEVVDRTLSSEYPKVLDYLESQLPAEGFACSDEPSIADISIACFFRNLAFVKIATDAARWPKTAAHVERVLALDAFTRLFPFEAKMMRTPLAHHRSALAALGAPLMTETYGTDEPRAGIMPGTA
jgi:glutathione S-transferase